VQGSSWRVASRCALAVLAALALAGLPAIAPATTATAQSTSAQLAAAQSAKPVTVPGVPASAMFVRSPRIIAPTPGIRQACATPTRPGQMACMALVNAGRGGASAEVAGGTSPKGLDPQQLRQAYGLTSAAAMPADGETVAIVDAYNDPNAASDLAAYRSQFGLPACDESTGAGCVAIYNEHGGTSGLPSADPTGGWELEEALDLDMVSAICPNCTIDLIEANSANIEALAVAELTASHDGRASVVSDSWGSGAEFTGETAYDQDFYAPGVAIVTAGGDDGYGTQYPAVSPYVTAVGGTKLVESGGSWKQTAWTGVGSGCSELEPKPSWQTADDKSPSGCLNRTDNDVAADADPSTGVAVYDSVKSDAVGGVPGWTTVGGTSVATPIIAAAYALADIAAGGPGDAPLPETLPAAYPYQADSGLTAVTGGSNGKCEPDRRYLCTAAAGFNGPTGLGVPDGTAALTGQAADEVTVVDPGTRVVQAGSSMSLTLDTLVPAGTTSATYSASPASLPGSLYVDGSGLLRGTAPKAAGVYRITVTAKVSGAGTGKATFSIVVVPKIRDADPVAGPIKLSGGGYCLTDVGDGASAGTPAEVARCAGLPDQDWEFVPDGQLGDAGSVRIHGMCLAFAASTADGARASLQRCKDISSELWAYQGGDHLRDAGGSHCLGVRGQVTTGARAVAGSCGSGADTAWVLPPAAVLSGVAGICLTDPAGSSAAGTQVEVSGCGAGNARQWTAQRNGTLTVGGKCLAVRGASSLDGAAIVLSSCTGSLAQKWLRGPNGELINASSGRCLADPGNSRAGGTRLIQDDCYSLPGEIWVIS
jgi:hypothetical protein